MTINWDTRIRLPGADLREVVKAAYSPSRAQGLGFLHARDGGLPDEEVDRIVGRERGSMNIVASMDYVFGRSVKFTVYRNPDDGDLYVRPQWYDHSRGELEALLDRFGVAPSAIDNALAAQAREDEAFTAEQKRLADAGAVRLKAAGGSIAGEPWAENADLHAACDAGFAEFDYSARVFTLVPPTPADHPADDRPTEGSGVLSLAPDTEIPSASGSEQQ